MKILVYLKIFKDENIYHKGNNYPGKEKVFTVRGKVGSYYLLQPIKKQTGIFCPFLQEYGFCTMTSTYLNFTPVTKVSLSIFPVLNHPLINLLPCFLTVQINYVNSTQR